MDREERAALGLQESHQDEDLLPQDVRNLIEERWWRPIEVESSFDVLRHNRDFLAAPVDHPALFADHGVVHVRDITANAIKLAETANGLLLARRSGPRQQFLKAVALLTIYLHDIGMVDPTPIGRRVHALVAAQLPFTEAADDVIARLMSHRGAVVRRLEEVDGAAPFGEPIEVILREVMSLTLAHSKSTVPIALFNEPAALRRLVQACVFTSIDTHRGRPRTPEPPSTDDDVTFDVHVDRHRDPKQSYSWMVSDEPAHRALTHDVIDGLRVLRAADALRQRGTSLRTSAGYEIFVEAATGHAVYSLREPGNAAIHLLRVESAVAAGEANLRAATVGEDGHLRIALHRGAFENQTAVERSAAATALVVADIALDVLPTFSDVEVRDLPTPTRHGVAMEVLIERPSDNPRLAEDVARAVTARCPELAGRVQAAARVDDSSPAERDRYLAASPVLPDSETARRILAGAAGRGANVAEFDSRSAFADVRVASVAAREVLFDEGSRSVFVYLATAEGLQVHPVGGYDPEPVPAWFPVGVTGVVRRAERNASVIAHADLDVVIIPAEVYVQEWFRPLTADEFAASLTGEARR